jgi:hypothetical protein
VQPCAVVTYAHMKFLLAFDEPAHGLGDVSMSVADHESQNALWGEGVGAECGYPVLPSAAALRRPSHATSEASS